MGSEHRHRGGIVLVRKVDLVIRRVGDDDILRYAAQPHIEAVREVRVEQPVHAIIKRVAREIYAEQISDERLRDRPQRIQCIVEHKGFLRHGDAGIRGRSDGVLYGFINAVIEMQAGKVE